MSGDGARPGARLTSVWIAIAGLLWSGACRDRAGVTEVSIQVPNTDLSADSMPVVSEPAAMSSSSRSASLASVPLQLGGAGDAVAYVSLRPGTLPGGETVILRRRGSTSPVTAAMEDGGFDPVPLAAAEGDTVDAEVTLARGTTVHFSMRVPRTRRPRVVRTYPPPKKRDVALNTNIVIVFSEPIAGNTLTSSSVQLFRGTTAVAGTVSLLAGSATSAVFAPRSALEPSTEYRLVVSEDVRDLRGDALEARMTLDFATGTTFNEVAASVSVPDSVVLGDGWQTQLFATARDSSGTPIPGVPIAWSSDNAAVATVSPTGLVTAIGDGEAVIRASAGLAKGATVVLVIGVPEWLDVTLVDDETVELTWTDLAFEDGYEVLVTDDVGYFGVSFALPANVTRQLVGGLAAGREYQMYVAARRGGYRYTTSSIATVATPPTPLRSIEVSTSTTGSDLDLDGYSVSIDGTPGIPIGTNAVVSLTLPIGSHSVELVGVAQNCVVDGANPRTALVTVEGTARVAFATSCAPSGSAEIITVTTGIDPDPNGFAVAVDGGPNYAIATNGTTIVSALLPGKHLARLSGLAPNCDVTGANPREIDILVGQTVALSFDVVCAQVTKLAFVRYGATQEDIYSVNSNGTGETRLTSHSFQDVMPAWSPDGRKIAFVSNRDNTIKIYVMTADGSNTLRLTSTALNETNPEWSPDGSRIMFSGGLDNDGGIYVINADGTKLVRLTTFSAYDAAWSPDGSRIAYVTNRDGDFEIYVMNADGTNHVRLTNNLTADVNPAWSPDGTMIAAAGGGIFLMNADGSGIRRLPTGPDNASEPTWSPDGRKIAFMAQPPICSATPCPGPVIRVIRTDGTDLQDLVTGTNPAWQR